MALRDPDDIGYAGSRYVTQLASTNPGGAAGVNVLSLGISDALQAGKWDLLGTGSSGGRNSYTLQSQQSTWWSAEVEPPDAYSGKVKVTIDAVDNAHIRFSAESQDGLMSQAGNECSLGAGSLYSGSYWVIVNPFSSWILNVDNHGAIGDTNTAIAFGVLNTPRFLQEDQGLRECFYCFEAAKLRTALHISGARGILAYKDKDVTSVVLGLDGNSPLQLWTPWHGNLQNPSNVTLAAPNVIDDPTLSNPDLWYPFLVTPQVAWRNSRGTGDPRMWRGWFWDTFSMVRSNSVAEGLIRVPDGHLLMAISLNTLNDNRANLYVCVDGVDD